MISLSLSLVYPADATPGHLLSVVPVQQLAMLHRRQQQQRDAQLKVAETKSRKVGPKTAPPPSGDARGCKASTSAAETQQHSQRDTCRGSRRKPRYNDVIRSQQQWLLQLQSITWSRGEGAARTQNVKGSLSRCQSPWSS